MAAKLSARYYQKINFAVIIIIMITPGQPVIILIRGLIPLGLTTSHEYAELEWPIDMASR
jgi:cbb3-type cytochrome oxidase subunit 1